MLKIYGQMKSSQSYTKVLLTNPREEDSLVRQMRGYQRQQIAISVALGCSPWPPVSRSYHSMYLFIPSSNLFMSNFGYSFLRTDMIQLQLKSSPELYSLSTCFSNLLTLSTSLEICDSEDFNVFELHQLYILLLICGQKIYLLLQL